MGLISTASGRSRERRGGRRGDSWPRLVGCDASHTPTASASSFLEGWTVRARAKRTLTDTHAVVVRHRRQRDASQPEAQSTDHGLSSRLCETRQLKFGRSSKRPFRRVNPYSEARTTSWHFFSYSSSSLSLPCWRLSFPHHTRVVPCPVVEAFETPLVNQHHAPPRLKSSLAHGTQPPRPSFVLPFCHLIMTFMRLTNAPGHGVIISFPRTSCQPSAVKPRCHPKP